jgi:competence ComEA-like helix-hairpin-helix protein
VLTKLSKLIGFTATEIKVLLFLIFVFFAGLAYRTYRADPGKIDYKNFDYSADDKTFESLAGSDKNPGEDTTIKENIDSRQEVLGFSSERTDKKKSAIIPGSKSININTADIKDLVLLPGIGEKTAQKIIELRKRKRGFTNLKELLEVKGIGEKKFNNIEKFLYIK